MKRFLIPALSLIALFAFGMTAANATHGDGKKNKVKFDSSVTLNYSAQGEPDPDNPYDPYDPYGPGSQAGFAGKVSSESDKCIRKRTVVVKRELQGPDAIVGTDTTSDIGRFVINQGHGADAGTYYAKAKKRKIEKKHKIVVCRKAVSETVTVP